MRSIIAAVCLCLLPTISQALPITIYGPQGWIESEWFHYTQKGILVVPGGSGATLSEARDTATGDIIDCSLRVLVRRPNGEPAADCPAQYITLWMRQYSGSHNEHFCSPVEGTNWHYVADADRPTDSDGITEFDCPISMGGHENELNLLVKYGDSVVAGQFESGNRGPRYNSPDMNGDNSVNLSDIVIFSGCVEGPYTWIADFNFDGSVNLTDITLFNQAIGSSCD